MKAFTPTLALIAAAPVLAQGPTALSGQIVASNLELATEIAKLRVPPPDLRDRLLAAFRQKLPAQTSPDIEAALSAEIDRQYTELLEPAAFKAAAQVYAQTYSRDQLEQIRNFYSTRTGQLLFGRDDKPKNETDAVAAANSAEGRAFLQSPVGQRENKEVAWLAQRAAADAVQAALPAVVNAVQSRIQEAARNRGQSHDR